MAYQHINGTFGTRGDNSAQRLDTLEEFAQTHAILEIMTVGYTTNGQTTIKAVVYQDDEVAHLHMVKIGLYDFADFTTNSKFQAFKNMSDRVRKEVGAYSNKFKVGAGYDK